MLDKLQQSHNPRVLQLVEHLYRTYLANEQVRGLQSIQKQKHCWTSTHRFLCVAIFGSHLSLLLCLSISVCHFICSYLVPFLLSFALPFRARSLSLSPASFGTDTFVLRLMLFRPIYWACSQEFSQIRLSLPFRNKATCLILTLDEGLTPVV